jgi:hypothetical protein
LPFRPLFDDCCEFNRSTDYDEIRYQACDNGPIRLLVGSGGITITTIIKSIIVHSTSGTWNHKIWTDVCSKSFNKQPKIVDVTSKPR